uniref:Cation/H+ exchanger transmembrane domain-containing protein n=1 Tax=Oryza barthii TaxID=65489 RepID=A0A0D3H2Y4_9ORYZ
MARSYYICSHIDPLALSPIPGIALDTLFLVAIQALAVILVSKFFHLFLRRYNQPSVISQILAGVVVGGIGLRSAIVHVDVDNVEDMYGGYISAARILYMFLVGLDMDIAALRHATHRCVAFTYATVAASLLLAAVVSSGMYGSMMHSPVKTPELLAATLMLALTNTSSIAVARIAAELKLTVTENGRLVVAAGIATNLICILGDGVLSSTTRAKGKIEGVARGEHQIRKGFLALAVAAGAVWMVRPAVTRINKRNVGQHHVGVRDLAVMLLAIWFVGNIPQFLGFDGMPTSFALGLAFPREGAAARSVADALAPPVKGIMLPFYFATIGMRMNFNSMSGAIIVPGVLITLLGLFGKAIGAAAVASYLSMPLSDALRFSVLLNIKGHVDTMNMKFAKSEGVWAEQALYAMIIGNLISTLVAGPVVAVVRRKEEEAYRTRHQAMESLGAEQELHMLACVHSAHAAPGMLSLIDVVCRGGAALDDAGAVCRAAEGVHARLLLAPCHKEQRYDGKMWCRLGGRRELNHGVLSRAPCTVGLLVDRPYRNSGTSFNVPSSVAAEAAATSGGGRTLLHPCSDRAVTHVVAAVFFGGADDREAVSLASRLAEHPSIGLTVFRFVKRSTYDSVTSTKVDELDMAFQEGDVDERFLWRQPPELLAGLERWADAGGEMGPAAAILASNDSLEMGSVLVMQQHTVVIKQ